MKNGGIWFIIALGLICFFALQKIKRNTSMTMLKPYLFANLTYPYSLPQLEYAYEALEPHVDKETMNVHHTKHHQGYINNLNKALEAHPEYQKMTLEELLIKLSTLPASLKKAVENHGGGHYNHSLFWQILTPKSQGAPTGTLSKAIEKSFGSFEIFKEKFNKAAQDVFGSGWAWLCLDQKNELIVVSTPNQDTPLSDGLKPILGLDVWEHAYYLHYQNRRMEYVAAWWSILNWERIADNYEKALKV